jgi:hypothetical protein
MGEPMQYIERNEPTTAETVGKAGMPGLVNTLTALLWAVVALVAKDGGANVPKVRKAAGFKAKEQAKAADVKAADDGRTMAAATPFGVRTIVNDALTALGLPAGVIPEAALMKAVKTWDGLMPRPLAALQATVEQVQAVADAVMMQAIHPRLAGCATMAVATAFNAADHVLRAFGLDGAACVPVMLIPTTVDPNLNRAGHYPHMGERLRYSLTQRDGSEKGAALDVDVDTIARQYVAPESYYCGKRNGGCGAHYGADALRTLGGVCGCGMKRSQMNAQQAAVILPQVMPQVKVGEVNMDGGNVHNVEAVTRTVQPKGTAARVKMVHARFNRKATAALMKTGQYDDAANAEAIEAMMAPGACEARVQVGGKTRWVPASVIVVATDAAAGYGHGLTLAVIRDA